MRDLKMVVILVLRLVNILQSCCCYKTTYPYHSSIANGPPHLSDYHDPYLEDFKTPYDHYQYRFLKIIMAKHRATPNASATAAEEIMALALRLV
jgi:hypothetical protein